MDRLIKESDAIKAVWKPQVKPNELIFDALKQAIESGIRNCPTADDRRQGHWEIYIVSPFDGEDCRCSECGAIGCVPYWDYCPHCGAKMEGVDDE